MKLKISRVGEGESGWVEFCDFEPCLKTNFGTSVKALPYFRIKWVEKTGLGTNGIPSLLVNSQLNRKSRVCIRLIPSHVGVFGNEVADFLAKEGSALPSAASGELFSSEIFSIHRAKANSTWKVPPTHEWYAGNRLGLSLQSEGTKSADCIGQTS
ncbi:hypothetical protein AVEN_103922-1 [Araneus ventricosus]|uniref:RNase H type-1 domain-containing protein n=1 Tax=Araneus ventricosus TaxID=182803 RepID=A0A4Y2WS19_ARAVE|nr:hypothetical protein AVEN_103922-1 [Araneus ventricosus]